MYHKETPWIIFNWEVEIIKRKKAISIKNAELRVDDNGFIEIVERDKEGEIINVIDMVDVANEFEGVENLSITLSTDTEI